MQLPWPFGRAQRSAASDGRASSGAASSDVAFAAVDVPPGDAWRRLPPLAETVGPPPLVAPNRPFAAGLAANDPPAPILQPLSHGRSLEAPRGIVVGVARPMPAAQGPALPRPVQRSPLPGSRRAWDLDDPGSSEAPAAPAPDPTIVPAVAVPPSYQAPAAPSRRLEVASPEPAAFAKPLTRAPEPARPAALVGLVGQPRASGRAPARAPDPVAPAIQRAPIAPAAQSPGAARPSEPGADGPRLTLGQARRLGLGAPVAGGPMSLAAQPFTAPAERPPIDSSLRPVVPPLGPPPGPATQRAPESAVLPLAMRPAPAQDARDAADPPVPQVAPQNPAAASSQPPIAASTAPAAFDTSRPAPAAVGRIGRPFSPLISAKSLRAGVQRAPLTLSSLATSDAGAGTAGATAVSPPANGAAIGPTTRSAIESVKIHRGSDAGQLSTALEARSFTHGGEIYMPDSHGPLTSGKGRALLAHELTHVSQQRRLGASLPAEHTPHGRGLEADAVSAERAPDMTLAMPSASESNSSGTPSAAAPPTSAVATTTPKSLPQRAPAQGGSPGGAAAPGRAGSAHSHSEQELEVLAHQLYARITRHLRREFLVDRERSGLALDLP